MGWMRKPSKFPSAIGLSVLAAGLVTLLMWVFLIISEDIGIDTANDLYIVILTLVMSILIIVPMFWYAASKKMGYVWA